MYCFKNSILTYKNMRDHKLDDTEAVDDTFSLCDLPIYSHDSSDCSSNSISSLESDNTFFEFFNPDFSYKQTDNIVFCGKSIPYGEAPNDNKCEYGSSGKMIQKSQTKSSKLNRARSTNNNNNNNNGSKIKWYSILFGLQKNWIPTRIDIAEMRSRQSKRTPKSIEKLEKCKNRYDNNGNRSSSSKVERRLSYLARSFSCKANCSLAIS